jgi:hypothetical protein
MIYIVTSEGFLKDSFFDKEKLSKCFIYTNKIREAKIFKCNKSAKDYIEKNNLNAFIWNLKEQEPIKDKYRIRRRSSYINCNTFERTHDVLEYCIERIVNEHNSDLTYLKNNLKIDEYYNFEQAVEICKEKNLKMLAELKYKINNPEIY